MSVNKLFSVDIVNVINIRNFSDQLFKLFFKC